jgi:hypothetical protein
MNPQQQHDFDVATSVGWKYFCDFIPAETPQLVHFWLELKARIPELVVYQGARIVVNRTSDADNIRYDVFRKIVVALENNPNEEVGAIEYDKYGDKYTLYSRLIANEKFGRWNSDYRSKSSKHMKNLFKLAKEVLVQKQLQEVMADSSQKFFNTIGEVRANAARRLRDMVGCVNAFEWREELLAMHKANYVPEREDIRKAMEYVVANEDTFNADYNYRPRTAFIWIKPDCVMYRCIDGRGVAEGGDVTVASTEVLPEDIRSKLYVLMIGDAKKHIDEVGIKEADDKFWVVL